MQHSMQHKFIVREATWAEAAERLRAIRACVFIREQGVPEEMEWDGLDEGCIHLLAETAQGDAIGTVRLQADGHIGRMAVLKEWRGRGVGSALLLQSLEIARAMGLDRVVLNAQTSALGFYRKSGFTASGGEFMDAGIPHYRMERILR